MSEAAALFRSPLGLSIHAGAGTVELAPFAARAGDWLAFVPAQPVSMLGADLAKALARVFVTILQPAGGSIELFGQNPGALGYLELQQLRRRLGFVQGHGGLLSNRNLHDNVALPASIHARNDEEARVGALLASFDLEAVAQLRPDQVDGATRFRACAARALMLEPPWVVVEGVGDFDAEAGPSLTWRRLLEYRARGHSAAAVCLPRPLPGFERWFTEQGGRLLRYRAAVDGPPAPSGRSP